MKLLTGRLKYNLQCRNQFETTKNILTCKNSPHTHTHKHSNLHKYKHTNKQTQKQAHTHKRRYKHTNKHKLTHTHIQTRAHILSKYSSLQPLYLVAKFLCHPVLFIFSCSVVITRWKTFPQCRTFSYETNCHCWQNSPTSDFAQRRTLLSAK